MPAAQLHSLRELHLNFVQTSLIQMKFLLRNALWLKLKRRAEDLSSALFRLCGFYVCNRQRGAVYGEFDFKVTKPHAVGAVGVRLVRGTGVVR